MHDLGTADRTGGQQAEAVPVAPAPPPAPPASGWTARRWAVLLGAYAAGLGGMILVKGVFISPDRYFLILLVPALALGVARGYVRDFLPFVALVLLYEEARGVAHWIHVQLGYTPWYRAPIDFDRVVSLGHMPPEVLQRWLWTGHLRWYDQILALLDRAHFFVPPTLLFLIWLENRALFYRCAATIVLVSFAAALCFLLFPVAPPWRAAEVGLLHPLVKIGSVQASSSPVSTDRSLIANLLLSNPYAAMPSLHTAYSLLTAVFAWRWRRRVGYVFLAYPALMWLTIVYFADHYIADIAAGIVFAVTGWLLVGRALRPGGRLARLAGPFPPPLAAARTFRR